jgi:ketosteroid isomerase-like protein
MDAAGVAGWLARYERAWRSPGTDQLTALFTPDATYSLEPYAEQLTGVAAIARMWESEREGPDEVFRMTSEIVAVDGDVAVVRVEVGYRDPVAEEFRDLWIIRFAADGRCAAFEEWPFPAPDGISR